MAGGLLLDTNYISKWQRGEAEPPEHNALFASTAALQELYNMQVTNSWEHRYVPHAAAFHDNPSSLNNFRRTPFRFKVSFPAELAEFGYADRYEQGHVDVREIHSRRRMKEFRTLTVAALGSRSSRIVCAHYEFVLRQSIEPILVDEVIAQAAVLLLQDLLAKGINLKADRRNTFNDMLILATALALNLELRTDDKLLFRTAVDHGMEPVSESDGFTTLTPDTEPQEEPAPPSREESKNYINAPWRDQRPGDSKLRAF
ncbi:type II toxin-antitoxin system VapC family toxin [Nocardia asteroides]|uniref:type II toxin-antitoxin system VapC family toxin n=1 Tax=Nocardia asteroides TaxID=1824 RepID=UPI0034340DBB